VIFCEDGVFSGTNALGDKTKQRDNRNKTVNGREVMWSKWTNQQ